MRALGRKIAFFEVSFTIATGRVMIGISSVVATAVALAPNALPVPSEVMSSPLRKVLNLLAEKSAISKSKPYVPFVGLETMMSPCSSSTSSNEGSSPFHEVEP